MKTYKVASKSGAFEDFSIEDNGLGYLDFNIFEQLAIKLYGPIGKIIGYSGKTSDILIKPPDKVWWYSIKHKRNSSETYLEAVGKKKYEHRL